MFGRRCSLCNGKLDSKNVCKECGLDNTKSDKYYKINQSSCDGMPLTHVHEEKPKKTTRTVQQKTSRTVQQKTSRTVQKKKGKAASIISIIAVVISLTASIYGIVTESYDTEPEPEYLADESYDPYAYVDKVHPQDGEHAEYLLTSGEYIVGIHIPEGDYVAIVDDDFDTVQVKDNDNGIYLYEYPGKSGGNYLDNLRLFNGAIVSISTRTSIELQSENAQYQNMGIMLENTLKDVYVLEVGKEASAGKDFDAGVYNLYAAADYAYVYMTYEDEYGEEWNCYSGLEIGEESERGPLYQNVVIPDGAHIYCEEGDVELIPANAIGDMDYSRYYW